MVFFKVAKDYHNNFSYNTRSLLRKIILNIIYLLARISYFINEWVLTTNHRRLAILYFLFIVLTGFVGLILATIIRLELAYPGHCFLTQNAERYLTLISVHGIVMVFFIVIPLIFGGFANFLLPTQLGIRDVAFPRLNSFMFWLTPSGFVLLIHILLFDRSYTMTHWLNYGELKNQLRRRYNKPQVMATKIVSPASDSILAWRLNNNNSLNDTKGYLLHEAAPSFNNISLTSFNDIYLKKNYLNFGFIFSLKDFFIDFIFDLFSPFFLFFNCIILSYSKIKIVDNFFLNIIFFDVICSNPFLYYFFFYNKNKNNDIFLKDILNFFFSVEFFFIVSPFYPVYLLVNNDWFFSYLTVLVLNTKRLLFCDFFSINNFFFSPYNQIINLQVQLIHTLLIQTDFSSFFFNKKFSHHTLIYDILFFLSFDFFFIFCFNSFNTLCKNIEFVMNDMGLNILNFFIFDFLFLTCFNILNFVFNFILNAIFNFFLNAIGLFNCYFPISRLYSAEFFSILFFGYSFQHLFFLFSFIDFLSIFIGTFNTFFDFYFFLHDFNFFLYKIFYFFRDYFGFYTSNSFFLFYGKHQYVKDYSFYNTNIIVIPSKDSFFFEKILFIFNDVFFDKKYSYFFKEDFYLEPIYFSLKNMYFNNKDLFFFDAHYTFFEKTIYFFYLFLLFYVNTSFLHLIISLFSVFFYYLFNLLNDIQFFIQHTINLFFSSTDDFYLVKFFSNIKLSGNFLFSFDDVFYNKNIFFINNVSIFFNKVNNFTNTLFIGDFYLPELTKEKLANFFDKNFFNFDEKLFQRNINSSLFFNHLQNNINFYTNNINIPNVKTFFFNLEVLQDWRLLKLEREIWRTADMLTMARQSTYYRKKFYSNFYDPSALVSKVSIWLPNQLIPGWAFVTPYTSRLRYTAIGKVDIALVVVFVASLGSIFSAVNYVITYRYLGAPSLKNRREVRSFFVDSLLVGSRMILLANPALLIGILLLLSDRHFNTSIFDFSGGGDTVLFQHLFWFFGHPEVYIIIIPCFGFMNSLLPHYLRKRLSGRLSLQFSMYTIAFMGFAVWGHHLYMVGLANSVRTLYSTMTVMISVPASTKVLHWCVTLIQSTFNTDVGFLFLLAFMYFFVLGGLSGMFVAHIGFDTIFHDTFYVIGHFHVMLAGAAVSCLFAAFYFYFPTIFGVRYSRFFAYLHFIFYVSGQLLTLIPMFWLGYAGMPRRIMDYPSVFGGWHSIISSGHILTFLGLVFFLCMLVDSFYENRAPLLRHFGVNRLNTRLNFYFYEARKLHSYRLKSLPLLKGNFNEKNKAGLYYFASKAELSCFVYTITKK